MDGDFGNELKAYHLIICHSPKLIVIDPRVYFDFHIVNGDI